MTASDPNVLTGTENNAAIKWFSWLRIINCALTITVFHFNLISEVSIDFFTHGNELRSVHDKLDEKYSVRSCDVCITSKKPVVQRRT